MFLSSCLVFSCCVLGFSVLRQGFEVQVGLELAAVLPNARIMVASYSFGPVQPLRRKRRKTKSFYHFDVYFCFHYFIYMVKYIIVPIFNLIILFQPHVTVTRAVKIQSLGLVQAPPLL